ncbi:MAG: hypothetical protein ACKVKF_26115, partial [Rhodobacterales bacterium]
MYQDIHQTLLLDLSLPPATRARLRQCARPGSGAWLSISNICPVTSLTDEQFIWSLQQRLGAPRGAITLQTRCTNETCIYNKQRVPCVPGIEVGPELRKPRYITAREHFDAVHWEHCPGKGLNIRRHNEIMRAIVVMVRQFGHTAEQLELAIGVNSEGKTQFVDARALNWTSASGPLYLDASVASATHHLTLARAASVDDWVTLKREAVKTARKGPLSETH